MKRLVPLILLLGDLLALIVFVYVGQRDHELIDEATPILGVLWTAGEFALPWIAAGWLLGAFPRGETWTTRSLLARSLNAWLVAAPLGLLLRAYVLGRAILPTVFVTATLVFGGLLMLGWRLAFALAWRVAGRARSSRPSG